MKRSAAYPLQFGLRVARLHLKHVAICPNVLEYNVGHVEMHLFDLSPQSDLIGSIYPGRPSWLSSKGLLWIYSANPAETGCIGIVRFE